MRNRVIRLGATGMACLVLAGCGVGMQDLPLGRTADGPDYAVTLQLSTAEGLLLGADVLTGQKVIGRVANLSTDTVGAKVRLSLARETELPDNVQAAVELPSALGNPFIRLIVPAQPSSRPLRQGDVIAESSTTIGPQIESALATLGTVVSGSGIGQLHTVVDELNKAFAGRSGEVRGLMDTMTTLLGSATANQNDFDTAIDLAARVSRQLAGQQKVVDGYLDAMPETVRLLSEQRDSIASLLASTTTLATNTNAILAASPEGLDGTLHDASALIAALASFNGRIQTTLGNMNTFLGNFGKSVHGDYLNFDGALDIPGGIDKLITGGPNLTGPATTPAAGTLASLLAGGGVKPGSPGVPAPVATAGAR
ncbi:MCE family protein [Rhodococcus spelaei]|uniref:MCE family protein n=1 Tax=Rhodococcus spelaei TaxID=2546320 RepID=A0A541B943_9NOCA|nr:MCE family protein [Rhodococcus spelaei]TQF68813.1 MCE family protein [Rhodococcus spelaei]